MYKIKRYSYSLPVISTAPIWRKLSYGEINHLYIKDVDVFFMNKIEYFQIPFDECERGIKVIFNEMILWKYMMILRIHICPGI